MTSIGSSLNQAMGGFGIGLLSGGSNGNSGLSALGSGLSGIGNGMQGIGNGIFGMPDMSSFSGDLGESSMGGPQQLMSMFGGGSDMGSLGLGSMPGFGGLQGLMGGMQGGNSIGNMLMSMQKMMDMMSQMMVMMVLGNMANSMTDMMSQMGNMFGGGDASAMAGQGGLSSLSF